MSQIMAKLNEIDLYRITRSHQGRVVVAGGEKFTASFETEEADRDSF